MAWTPEKIAFVVIGTAILSPFLFWLHSLAVHVGLRGARRAPRTEEGTEPTPKSESLVGRSVITCTPLRPSGSVLVDGQRYDARTEGEFLNSGVQVIVAAEQGSTVVVRKA